MTIFEDFTDLKTAIGRDFGYTDFPRDDNQLRQSHARPPMDSYGH
jgi:hypothetical protein